MTANQRYKLFRPEKRPFFMENASIFETPINVMFSRRIVDPDVGVRLTARSTAWAIGGLVANDRSATTDPSSRLCGPARDLAWSACSGCLLIDRAWVSRQRNATHRPSKPCTVVRRPCAIVLHVGPRRSGDAK